MSELIFYDIPGNTPESLAWSPNTWIVRYVLNFKGIKYRTEWVEFPDIEALAKKIGAEATSTKPNGDPYFTLPILQDPSRGKIISDSVPIIDYLESTFPNTPTVFPTSTKTLQTVFAKALGEQIMYPLLFVLLAPISASLNPSSDDYFRRTREQTFGKTLEEISEGETGEENWQKLESGLETVAGWFKESGDQEFIGGDAIIFADLLLASRLIWARAIFGEKSAQWSRITKFSGGRWGKYLAKFEKYHAVV